MSNILNNIIKNKYIDKKTKIKLLEKCHNDKIISILKYKRITKYKKNLLIHLLKNDIYNNLINIKSDFMYNIFLIIPSEISLLITTFVDVKSLYTLYESYRFYFFSENYNYYWKNLYIKTFGNLKREITPKYWSCFYILSLNKRCVDCNNITYNNEPFYNIKICNKCKKLHKCLQLITYTTAKNDFYLSSKDLINIEHIEVDNPHYKSGYNMKLYLKSDVYKYSLNKYIDEEGLQKRKEKSLDRKLKLRENKIIKTIQQKNILINKISMTNLTMFPGTTL